VKTIVIDPRRTELAKLANFHLQVRPGTDGALALSWLNTIISEELYDKEFVEKWTVGFDKLAERVKDYPAEKAAEISWVPAHLIRDAARMYATTKPATMQWGVALDQQTNAFQAIRAISCLKAITGNIDKPGASECFSAHPVSLRLPGRVTKTAIGQKEYPLYYDELRRKGHYDHVPLTTLVDEILAGNIKAVIFLGKELVLMDPNTSKTLRALEKLPFMVSMNMLMTDTSKLADIVLPAASFFERNGIRFYGGGGGLPFASTIQKAIEPLGECKSDANFILELAGRLGYEEDIPWEKEDEFLGEICRRLGTTWEELTKNPRGLFWTKKEYMKYEKCGFDTPSGKVELYSEKMERYGYDPLPSFTEPAESPISRPDIAKEYPLILTTGGRSHVYEQSQHRHLVRVRRLFPDPIIEINPEDSHEYGVADGDQVEVETLRGRIKVKAKVTDDIMKGVVHVYHGWAGEANVNWLTSDEPRDPVSGGASFRALLCRIKSLHRRCRSDWLARSLVGS
jgi:anaerobic selenocysteine-containing dehydrogenase